MSTPTAPTGPSMNDSIGAFLQMEDDRRPALAQGALDDLGCGVKDVFDIQGCRTGYGNPTWRATHRPATAHADAVAAVLLAGAHVVGKTHTDELAFSIAGNNHHYGRQFNSAAPERITGGSSSGSASAVAAGLCEFALGTDTGGSVRAPASFCGIFGFRPTHGVVSSRGVCHLAPSFDTVGWFTRDVAMLERIGGVLLPQDLGAPRSAAQHIALETAWSAVQGLDTQDRAHNRAMRERLFGVHESVRVPDERLTDGFKAFRTLQFREVWQTLGAWVNEFQPELGPGVGERIRLAGHVTDAEVAQAQGVREQASAFLAAVLGHTGVLVLPTVPGAAPRHDAPHEFMEVYRQTAMRFLSIAGLAGSPQVSMPLLRAEGLPLGLSLIGPRGADRWLLAQARTLWLRSRANAA